MDELNVMNGWMWVLWSLSVLGSIVSGVSSWRARGWCERLDAQLQLLQRQVEELEQQQASLRPAPVAGTGFVLSDQEQAVRERTLLATSRSRARVLEHDAQQKLIKTFRRGSLLSHEN